jgi:transposase
MLTQEEYVNEVLALKRRGWTIAEIANELDYHPATISKWLRDGGPPEQRRVHPDERVIDDRWARRIEELIAPPSRLLATSVFEIIRVEGFTGSYPSVVRAVRGIRGPRFRPAPQVSVPIETAPGEESQFDFSDCSARGAQFGLGPVLWCFGAVLCWSRHLFWWFTTSVDRQHTFEGLLRHFEAAAGVPKLARTDRMGALGTSQGRRFSLHPPTVAFAAHHDTEIKTCQAGDAKRKGKIERPFRGLEISFLEELAVLGPPASMDELNQRARCWLAERVNGRVHRGTKETPNERLATERRFLRALPSRRFDTAYVEPRRVHVALPFIEWEAVRYSVPPECLGQRVACRVEVDSDRLEITWGGGIVATHRLAPKGIGEVWDPAHRRAAEQTALGRTRPPLRLVDGVRLPRPASSLAEFDVEVPDLAARYGAP